MIETKDLILRKPQKEDLPQLFRNLWSREEVFQYLLSSTCTNISEAEKMLESLISSKYEYILEEKTTNQIVGTAGIQHICNDIWTVTDILISPEKQGRGYATQALKTLTDHVNTNHGATTIYYKCFDENIASRKLALRCGFEPCGEETIENPRTEDSIILVLFCRII